ncbi:hypothetical protein FQA39_LY07500 [Lamprigera yunnana]|nr:hypothetical protein FQA39_LY07500 [Lamprigera yunnana]
MNIRPISTSTSVNFSWASTSNVKGTAFRKKKTVKNTDEKVIVANNELKKKDLHKLPKKKNIEPILHIKRKHKKDKQKLLNKTEETQVNVNNNVKTKKFEYKNKKPIANQFHDRKHVSEKLFTESGKNFSDLNIHRHLISNLEKNDFKTLTTVQEKVIPIVISGKDVLVRSQTGSGKTLAYALPILNALVQLTPRIQRKDGLQALVIVPTRELALQTHELINKINTFQWIVVTHLCGGENRKSEKDRLRKGVHVLIGTPGRLLDHVFHTSALKLDKVRCLVLDEADQLLDMGFRPDILSLVEELNKAKSNTNSFPEHNVQESEVLSLNDNSDLRQTILLSASLTKGVTELADFVLKNHAFVDALGEDLSESASDCDRLVIPDTIRQSYILTTVKNKLIMLSAIVVAKSKQNSKIFIFMASTQMVEYHYDLFNQGLLRMPVNRGQHNKGLVLNDVESDSDCDEDVLDTQLFKLHGNMDQKTRKKVFMEFRAAKSGILLCTDVAARGVDVPTADCIIQYTGPQTDKDYLHRVGRTGRAGKSGSAIIFLTEGEEEYISRLRELQVNLKKLNNVDFLNCLCEVMNEPDYEKAAKDLQYHYEQVVLKNKDLQFSGCLAYSTWSRFYNSYPAKMRSIFDFKKINLGHYAKTFALRNTPTQISKIVRREVDNIETPRLNKKLSNYKEEDTRQQKQAKRKITNSFNISEFDSGLEPIKKKKKNVGLN